MISISDITLLTSQNHFGLPTLTGSFVKELFAENIRLREECSRKIGVYLTAESVANSNWGEYIFKEEYRKRITDLFWAITNKRLLEVKFYDHGQTAAKEFRPLKIIVHRGTLHLIGWLKKKNSYELQVQELDSFTDFRVTDKRYSRKNEDLLAEHELQKRFGIHDSIDRRVYKVRLRISEGPALTIQNHLWHPTQKFRREKGGTWIMEMNCEINIELIGWIFSWLEHIKVLGPDKLLKFVADRARVIGEMYSGNLMPVNPINTDDPGLAGR